MRQVDAILDAYVRGDDTVPTAQQPLLRTALIFFAIFGALFVAFLPMDLWGAWIGGNWHEFWTDISIPLRVFPYMLGPLIIGQATQSSPLRRERVRAWRESVQAGDDTVAPVVSAQPEPWAEDTFDLGPRYIGPLREHQQKRARRLKQGSSALLVFATLLAVGVFWAGAAAAPLGLPLLRWGDLAGLLPLAPAALLAAVSAGCLAGGIVLLRQGMFLCGPLVLVATDVGIEWIEREGPRGRHIQRRIAWTQMRSLARIKYRRDSDWARMRIYLLDAGERRLVWRADSTSEVAEQEASKRLIGLIVKHAGIPMREVTESIKKLSNELAAVKTTKQANKTAAGPTPDRQDARVALDRKRRLRVPALIGAALVVALAAVLVLPFILQNTQGGYYAGIERRALAATPIYSSSLASNDGHWQPKSPSAKDPASYTFQHGAYYVTGGGPQDDLRAPMDQTYGDAAVEVTVRQQGEADSSAEGLLLRWQRTADGKDRAIVFQVTPDGHWRLYRLDEQASPENNVWTWLAGGHSDAIRAGVGASNTLVVVMRGPEYLCYVNGQWVGGHLDDTFTSGKVGLDVNGATTTGIFSDFKVYRL